MAAKFLSTIILLILSRKCVGTANEDDLVVYFKEFKECPNLTDAAVVYKRLDINFVGNDTFIMDGELQVLEILDGDLSYTMDITHCGDQGLDDACKHKFHHQIDNICLDVKFPGSFVKSILEDSGIPPKCPILPGTYHLTPKAVTLDSFTKSIVKPGVWKLESRIIRKKSKKVELCFYCKGEVKSKSAKSRNRADRQFEKKQKDKSSKKTGTSEQ